MIRRHKYGNPIVPTGDPQAVMRLPIETLSDAARVHNGGCRINYEQANYIQQTYGSIGIIIKAGKIVDFVTGFDQHCVQQLMNAISTDTTIDKCVMWSVSTRRDQQGQNIDALVVKETITRPPPESEFVDDLDNDGDDGIAEVPNAEDSDPKDKFVNDGAPGGEKQVKPDANASAGASNSNRKPKKAKRNE